MNKLIVISVLTCFLFACAAPKSYQAPTVPTHVDKVTFENSDTLNTESATESSISWWKSFQDQKLVGLIEQALKENNDIKIAFANLEAARAESLGTQSERLPSVQAEMSAGRNRINASSDANIEGGVSLSWEVDVFNRIDSLIMLSNANQEAVFATLKETHLIIAAEVAQTYMQLRGAQRRLQIAKRNANNQKNTFELVENLVKGGVASRIDSANAKAQFELTRSSIPEREAEVQKAINKLVLLTGFSDLTLKSRLMRLAPLPNLPAQSAVVDAAILIKQRPDIQRAAHRFVAATAHYNLAVADQFPQVNLLGSIGFNATNFSDLGSNQSLTSFIGPSLNWSMLNFGRVNARIQQQDALAQRAIYEYQQAINTALEEAQNAINDFHFEELKRQKLLLAASASFTASQLARERMKQGDIDFLQVLDTERTQLQVEDALAVSELNSAVKLIRVYKAFGSGWAKDSESKV